MKIKLSREEVLFLYAKGLRDFRWVDLTDLDLAEANLTDSDFTDCEFNGTWVRDTIFAYCKMQGAKFTNAIGKHLADFEGVIK